MNLGVHIIHKPCQYLSNEDGNVVSVCLIGLPQHRVFMAPVISASAKSRIERYIEIGIAEGATLTPQLMQQI